MEPVRHRETTEYIQKKIEALRPIFARAAVGDFSSVLTLPEDTDEFIELYVGIQVMLEVIQEKITNAQRTVDDLATEQSWLAYEHARDAALLSSIGQGIIATDKRGIVTKINSTAEEMLGFSPGQVTGKLVINVLEVHSVNGRRISPARRALTRVLATQRKVSGTYQYRRTNGEFFDAYVTITPIIFEGALAGTIDVFYDVTKERAIDRAKSEFVSLASHQLRTPLSIVSWYLEQILEGGAGRLNKKQRGYLTEAKQASGRMTDLVNNFLKVSRIELGTLVMHPRRVNPVALLKSVLRELKPRFSAKKLSLVEEYSKSLPAIKVDPTYLRMVYQNLLTNAIKFSPDRGTITVALRVVRAGAVLGGTAFTRRTVVCSVADTGYGIPPVHAKKIFSKLFRGDESHAHIEGTGIGLYLSKAIADLWKSDLWFESPTLPVEVQSQDRRGTTFYLTLPIEGGTRKQRG